MQHFLLSHRSKTLSIIEVARINDDEIFSLFKFLRWYYENGKPICPHCYCKECLIYKTRRLFKCKKCKRQFSVTSGTIFANRKLPLRDYLMALTLFTNEAKGLSALKLSRDLKVQYKTAFVLAHKIREAVIKSILTNKLYGKVELDGAYFGGYIKPANRKVDRVDRRKKKNQTGKRQCVFIIRERGGASIPTIMSTENGHDINASVAKYVDENATLYADEHKAYNTLAVTYKLKRINHSEAYSNGDCSTNQAESWFSRMRRSEIGQHHHVAGKYIDAYAGEMAYREDNRRTDNLAIMHDILRICLKQKTSQNWVGYWQKLTPSRPSAQTG